MTGLRAPVGPSSTRRHAATAALLTIAALCLACDRDDGAPEDRIRSAIDSMERAAEGGDEPAFFLHVSERYIDEYDHSRAQLRMMLRRWFRRSEGIRAATRIVSIEPSGTDAYRAVVVAGLSDGPITSPTSDADVYRFDLRFELEDDGAWRVARADWREATVADLFGGT